MDHFNKSLTASASLDHQCFWEKWVNGEIRFVKLVIAHSHHKWSCTVLGFRWRTTDHCQLRADGTQNKINFQILLFFFSAANQPPFLKKKLKFGVLSWRPISASLPGYGSVPLHSLTQAKLPIEPTELLHQKARGGWVCTKHFSKTPVALKHHQIKEQLSPLWFSLVHNFIIDILETKYLHWQII